MDAAWDATIVDVEAGHFEVRITMPDDAIPIATGVQIWALRPEVLELSGLPEDSTDLMAYLRRVAADFPVLLDRFA